MTRPILLATIALLVLPAARCDLHRGCAAILSGASTAREIADVLARRGVAVEAATKVGNAIELGEQPLSFACAMIPPSPVAVPGQ